MCKAKIRIVKLFQLIFAVSMFIIVGICLSKPLNNLVPQRMVFYTLFWVILFILLWYLSVFIEKRIAQAEQWMKYILPVFLCLYGVALYGVSCLLRSSILTDYESIYNAALCLARGEEVTNWGYFSKWYNNAGPMLALSVLFFLGSWLPASIDVYYFVLLLQVIQVVGVIACLYYLAGKFVPRHKTAAHFMVLFVSVLWIPIWGNSGIFYSDQLSFGAGVFGLALLVKGWNKKKWYVYLAAAGAIWALGVSVRATVPTILIALLIMGFLFSVLWTNKRKIAVILVSFVLVFFSCSLYCKTLPYQQEASLYKMPVEYWLAVGLGENGTYAGSLDFVAGCEATANYEMRKEYCREYIAENINQMWNPDHLIGKIRQNFGCGDLGSAGYLLYREQPNLLWNWFSQEGVYFWKYSCLSTSFFFAVLFMLGFGSLIQFVKKREFEKADLFSFSINLAFWGLCLFLMLWEAQNKQIYNHSGWLILSLVCGVNQLGELFENRSKGRQK